MRPPIAERAFELAASGKFASIQQIRRALEAEGYERIKAHTSGPSIMKQLKALCVSSDEKKHLTVYN